MQPSLRKFSTLACVAALFFLLLPPGEPEFASALVQEVTDEEPDPMVPVGFVIIKSTTSYDEALRTVREANAKSGIPINLRGVVLDPQYGLMFSKGLDDPTDPLYAYPWYLPRGRYDDGVYLSVELSASYPGFWPGFYVVIAASGEPDSNLLKQTLSKVKPYYRDAYMKVAKIYHGCMH